MTDDLIARLRGVKDWWRAPGHLAEQCADALEAQARRIAELEEDCEMRRAVNFGQSQTIDGYVARIAALEAENASLKQAMSKPWMGSARAALGEK